MRLRKGSALLLVVALTSILSLIVLGSWYKSSLFLDLALQREKFYKNFYLTESLLNYGCSLAKQNFENYLKEPKIIDLSSFIKIIYNNNDMNNLKSMLIIQKFKKAQALFISVVLQDGKNELCRLSCKIFKDNEVSKNKKSFIIQNFTIGNLI
ncbi:hypothetical protein KAT08_02395 [Candidatus Babeliales bacterium]|nr:hypothetical protein [Candidatus Babeliales bacterium]